MPQALKAEHDKLKDFITQQFKVILAKEIKELSNI
jgi:hypothetical protein